MEAIHQMNDMMFQFYFFHQRKLFEETEKEL
jgi:hypothetical protein